MIKLLLTENRSKWTKTEFEFYLNQLPKNAHPSILAYKHWEDRQARVLSKLLIKKQLIDFNTSLNLTDIKTNVFNKPYVEADFNFSIAHTDQLVACAACVKCVLGLDVELMHPVKDDYPTELFTHEECHYLLESNNKTYDFYKLFTRKEALAKASGEGILMDFKKYSVLNHHVVLNGVLYDSDSFIYSDKYMISIITNTPKPLFMMDVVSINALINPS